MLNRWRLAVVSVGLALGVAASVFVPGALASRNSSGTYSLPSGNPVVTGTPITSSWANTTLSDVSTELTNSLDRSGRGAMTAPLQLSTGSCAVPSLTFSADADVGLWRSTTNETAMCVASNSTQKWTSTGAVFPMVLTSQAGITATQSTTDGNAITATGNGTGIGVSGVTATGTGVKGVATGGGYGVHGDSLSGHAVRGTTATGIGVYGITSGAGTGVRGETTSSGSGVIGYSSSTGAGGTFVNDSTGNALVVGSGHAKFTGANPGASTGFTNTVTPSSIVKAWGRFNCAAGSCTAGGGFNVGAVTINTGAGGTCGDVALPTGTAATASTGALVSISYGDSSVYFCSAAPVATNSIRVCCTDPAGATPEIFDINSWTLVVFGLQ